MSDPLVTTGSGATGRPVESELKYRISDAAAGERLLADDLLAGFAATTEVRSVRHEDRYVDTADGLVAAGGFAARLRETDGTTTVSLKALRRIDEGGALHRRDELEGPADAALPPAEWEPSDARSTLLELAGDAPLVDRVSIRQVRRKRDYRRGDAVIELSVDEVDVVAGDRVIDRFAELELELREGPVEALDPLADLLSEVEELVPAETSKLERALEALRRDETDEGGAEQPAGEEPGPAEGGGPPGEPAPDDAAKTGAPRRAGPKSPGVRADDHLAEAGRKVLRFHLARMVAREEGTRQGEVEELHAMRVATRRQRAAWRVFGDMFDPKPTRRHRRRLREVAARLGGVRDLDVLIEAAEAHEATLPAAEARAFERLPAAWRAQREVARAHLLRELDSPGYQRWVEDYLGFVATEGAAVLPVQPTDPHRVRDRMPSRIWAAYEQLRAYEAVLRWADVTTLHDLRIAAKWLRYTIEFVREALGRDSGPIIEKVVALQDHLGWMNDAEVAAGLARSFLVEHAGKLSEAETAAIGQYLVDRERDVIRLRRTMGPAWRGVASPTFRRALGRLVAGL
jgi:CHAD domain-containing protein